MNKDESPRLKKKKNPYKPQRDFKGYVKFLAISIVMMVVINHYLLSGERPHITKIKQEYYAEQARLEAEQEKILQQEQEIIESLLPPKIVFPDDGEAYFEAEIDDPVVEDIVEETAQEPPKEPITYNVAPVTPYTGKKSRIAIVIDDVGMNLTQSRAAIALDPNVTIALLPYARTVRELAAQAIAHGNEIIIHTPMEAMDSSQNLGSLALRVGMSPANFDGELQKILNSFEGYVGVNNHMGSRLTQDTQAMERLMRTLKSEGLYFLDSKTISTSVAAETAQSYGVPYAVRDVFLDHEETRAYTNKALKNLERIAREQGSAIAIGHPKKITMAALREWIPTLQARGFELVPLSNLIQKTIPATSKIEIKREKILAPLNLTLPATSGYKF